MAAEDKPVICEFCKKGRVTRRMEVVAFRQCSDKGYVQCRVMILIGTCDSCNAKSLDPKAEGIFDEAFQQEYKKLP
jgi:hypothetical protein